MARKRTRITLSLSVFAVALLWCMALGATAFAAPGDSVGNATDLNPYLGSSLTTDLVVAAPAPTGFYYFRTQLSAGNTLLAYFKPAPSVLGLKALVLPFKSGYRYATSYTISSGTARLSFMAPVTGMYTVYLGSSTPGTFTVSPSLIAPVRYSFKDFVAPSTVKPSKSFSLSVKLTPAYNGPTSPIQFRIYRKASGHWKYYKSVNALTVDDRYLTYTRFARSTSLPKGSFRVRASFRDAAHPAYAYTGYKYISVK